VLLFFRGGRREEPREAAAERPADGWPSSLGARSRARSNG
jgi:hypothetical protein